MDKNKKYKIVLSSFVLYIFAFFTAFTIFQITVFFLAEDRGIPVGLESYKIIFKAQDNSRLWTEFAVITIFGIPPFLCLLLSILTRKLYEKVRREKSNLKLYIIWLSLHFDNLFWGGIIAGAITQSGFFHFMSWMRIPVVVQIIISVAASIFLYYRYSFLNHAFTQTSPSRKYIGRHKHLQYKIFLIYIPFILATWFLLILEFPDNSIYEIILKITPILALVKTGEYIDITDIKLVRNSKVFSPDYFILILIFIYIITFQFIK